MYICASVLVYHFFFFSLSLSLSSITLREASMNNQSLSMLLISRLVGISHISAHWLRFDYYSKSTRHWHRQRNIRLKHTETKGNIWETKHTFSIVDHFKRSLIMVNEWSETEKEKQAVKKVSVRGILVLPIYVQSVRLPVGDDDEGRWNRERKENWKLKGEE